MGGTRWSDDDYKDRAAFRASTSTPTFVHDSDVRAGKASGVHASLDPHGVKVRESRDSDAHPYSHAVAVLLDVTGSMSSVPRTIQANLPKLMGLLIRKGYLEHPAILVGAIGDATCDRVPLQVGQFESGIEIESDLTNLYLEGGGGGHITESYELALWFMANKAATDCWEKRKKRGYLFVIGDETPYPHVSPNQVQSIIGDSIEGKVAVEDVVKQLKEKWDVYYILPRLTNHWDTPAVLETWAKLLGQNAMKLEDPSAICELIAGTVGLAEGMVDVEDVAEDLKELDTAPALIGAVSNALVPVAAGAGARTVARKKGSKVTVPVSSEGSGIEEL